MKFLLRPLMTTCTVLLALLLWWRPAATLIEVKPIDWAKEYEEVHTPADRIPGAMGYAREVIRSSKPHQSLTEFIAGETKGQPVQGNSDEWRNWHAGHFSENANSQRDSLYFRSDLPPFAGVSQERGYVEIRDRGAVDFLFYRIVPARYFHELKIPTSLRYPFRKEAVAVFLAALALMILNKTYRGKVDLAADSTAGKGCKFFGATPMSGLALLVLPFFYPEIEESIPAFVVGIFLLLAGLVGLAVFGRQLGILRSILSGKDMLAHWRYGPEEWRRYVEWEFTEERKEKRSLWLLISGITVVVGVGFLLVMRDDAAAWVFLVLLGLIVLLWMVAVLVPKLTYRRNIKGSGEVYLGSSGIHLNGSVHTWRLLGSRFESAQYRADPFPLLAVLYSYLMVAGRSLYFFRQYFAVSVPVPAGKEDDAKNIAKILPARQGKAGKPSGRAGKGGRPSHIPL